MAAQTCLDILNRLAMGQISPERALRRIQRLKEKQRQQQQQLHRRFFSCVTVRVRPEGRRIGLLLKVPIGLAGAAVSLAALSPKMRRRLNEQGISLREIRSLIRFLRYREAGFDIRVEAHDGSKVLVHN